MRVMYQLDSKQKSSLFKILAEHAAIENIENVIYASGRESDWKQLPVHSKVVMVFL